MPRRPDLTRRAELAAAAFEVLRTRGVGTSMRELADALGVKRPTLYFYFPDLGAVFETVLEQNPRSRAERAEFRRLHARVDRRLRSGGRDDLLPLLDSQLFLLALAPDLPPEVERDTRRMLELGEPVAVFVAPPGTTA